MNHKPFSESCVQNREPIQRVLQQYIEDSKSLLEIGSGTGQHAVYFAEAFPWISWQTSDLLENHQAINAWISDTAATNILPPIVLDSRGEWPKQTYDVIYSANTVHIMSEDAAQQMLLKLPDCMQDNSVFLLYGPFNYNGQYTSESNARFDQWLKQRDSDSGIKNFEWLQDIASASGLECVEDHQMPANNRFLIWRKSLTGQ